MIKFHSINSQLIPAEKAALKLNDLAILRSYSIFDFFRVREGVPIFLEDHLDRFEKSAQYLKLKIPVSRKVLIENIQHLIHKNGLKEASIRLLLTGGYSTDGISSQKPNLIIMEHEFKAYDPKVFSQGVRLLLHSFLRETPKIKTTNYLNLSLLVNTLKEKNAMEVLYYKKNKISECARSNFFIVKNNTIFTPKKKILKGITRKNIIRVAKNNFPLIQQNIKLKDLTDVTEAFISSTTKGIMPVIQIGDQIIGSRKPGPITQKLSQLLEQHKKAYIADRI